MFELELYTLSIIADSMDSLDSSSTTRISYRGTAGVSIQDIVVSFQASFSLHMLCMLEDARCTVYEDEER